jgi:hypothetical protein
VKPYYNDGRGIVIYHGDCREHLATLAASTAGVLVLTDPPYGIDWPTDYHTTREASEARQVKRGDPKMWKCKNHPPVAGDIEPFDPTPLLTFKKLALFGANHYASRLPDSASWLVWDKKTDRGAHNAFGDAEMVWCYGANFKSVRVFRHMWCGYQRDSETGEQVLHPTQKPVMLMSWILQFFDGVKVVLDPYMGSGPIAVAAKASGLNYTGFELREDYCESAVRRLQQEVLPLTEPQPSPAALPILL